jgi:hypothetical protein
MRIMRRSSAAEQYHDLVSTTIHPFPSADQTNDKIIRITAQKLLEYHGYRAYDNQDLVKKKNSGIGNPDLLNSGRARCSRKASVRSVLFWGRLWLGGRNGPFQDYRQYAPDKLIPRIEIITTFQKLLCPRSPSNAHGCVHRTI